MSQSKCESTEEDFSILRPQNLWVNKEVRGETWRKRRDTEHTECTYSRECGTEDKPKSITPNERLELVFILLFKPRE